MGRLPKSSGQDPRPSLGTVYLTYGNRGMLHVSVVGSDRTLCNLGTVVVPQPVTVHDRITCPTCVGIVGLVRGGYVVLSVPA